MLRAIFRAIGGEGFGSKSLPLIILAKHLVIQKLFRFNSSATWPVHWTSCVKAADKIERGTRFPGLSMGCHIDGRNGIKFGENVWIGPRVSIISMNHETNDYTKYVPAEPIVIMKDCWFGTNAVVLPGVTLGEHTIVASGAIVTKSFPEGNQILAGCPAKVVKQLPPYGSDGN